MTAAAPEASHAVTTPDVSGVDERSRGLFWGIAAYVFWGLATIFWKQLSGFSALELIGYRIISSALLMGVVVAVTGKLRPLLSSLRSPALLRRVALSAVLLTMNWTAYVWAVVHGQVIATALGYFITPIGLTMAGVFVLHEHLRAAQRLALALAVAAVVVLTIGYGAVPWASLIIACSWVSYAFTKKQTKLSAVEGLAAETFVLLLPAIVVVAVTATQPGNAVVAAGGADWALLALTGAVTTAPLLMFAFAARRLPLTVMALVQYIVPTINFLLGWLVYDEQLNALRIIGFALVWTGLVAVTLDSLRRARRVGVVAA